MGSSKKQTVGYAYYMGLHMAVCKGPIDALLAIRAGGRDLFTGKRWASTFPVASGHFPHPYGVPGSVRSLYWYPAGATGPVVGNEQILLFKPNLFGGDKREGGIIGALDVMFGGPTQTANDYLESTIGVPQPAYRNTFTAVMRGGMVGAMNPYLKAWQWRVRRTLAGWQNGAPWYPAKCEIDVGNGVKCMNPAHIIYQVLTDTEDGMGYPAATLNEDTFTDAADLFHAEGLGLFLKWMRSDKIETFLQAVLDHANAVLVQNPTTALFELIPMRNDYVDSELLTLTPDDATLEMFERATLAETVNEITVKWDDTFSLNEGSVTVQELANIQAMGGVVNQTKTYAGCPTESIAKRLAQRDLDIGSALLARVRLRANRKAYGVIPGRCIALEGFTKLGLGRVVIRPLRVNYGGSGERGITIEGAEDVFALPTNTYVGSQPDGWAPPNTTPLPSPNVEAFEAPFRDVAQVQGSSAAAAMSPAAGFLAFAAQHPGGLATNFTLVTRPGTSGAFNEMGNGDFTPTATLSSGIGKTDTVLALTALSRWAQVQVGTVAFIGAHPDAEAVRIDALGSGTVTVARGVLDTVPKAWASGTRLWAYDDFAAGDPTEYAAGELIQAKALTITSTDVLDEGLAVTDAVTFNSRAARPYPPARLRINGLAWPATAEDTIVATWSHRDRILQSDTVVGTEEAGIGPEPGTTYTARWYYNSTLVQTNAGLSVTTSTYTPDAPGNVRLELLSVRDGLDSWQMQVWEGAFVGGPTEWAGSAGITWTQSAVYSGMTAANATNMRDANGTTGTGTNSTANEWIQADLGEPVEIVRVQVAGGSLASWGPVAAYLNNRVLQSSDDGSVWTTRATISGVTDSGTNQFRSFNITPTTARYWRLWHNGYLATSEFRFFVDPD